MPRHSEEFKEKMMLPNSMSVAQVSREAGVSEPTLYTWKNKYQNEGKLVPADP
ncbi:MAG: transposase [Sedimenticola sp.]